MAFLSNLFVGQPLHILAVGLALLMLYLVLRLWALIPHRRCRPLLIATNAWILYALWEWTVLRISPEANIRVDLMLIWPVVALLSAYGILRLLR